MKWRWSLLAAALLSTQGLAQDALPTTSEPGSNAPVSNPVTAPLTPAGMAPLTAPVLEDCCCNGKDSGFLTGNRNFQNFIGFISNPLQSIDPRAVTEICPLYLNNWISTGVKLIPGGDAQVTGPMLSVAVSDRLSMGLNQGGYAILEFKKERQGWLDFGGFVQYTVIEDVPDQFLLTAGLRLGSAERLNPRSFPAAASSTWHLISPSAKEFSQLPRPGDGRLRAACEYSGQGFERVRLRQLPFRSADLWLALSAHRVQLDQSHHQRRFE